MTNMLNDVRCDVAKKFDCFLSTEERNLLFLSIAEMLLLSKIARTNGLLGLEDAGMNLDESIPCRELLWEAIEMVVDGTSPELIEEILTTRYWIDKKDKLESVIYYIYIRGLLLIQDGTNPRVIEQIFAPFIPIEYKEECMQFIENIMHEYNETKYKEYWNRYQSINFVPKDIELQKELQILENRILGMPDDNIQRLLRDVDNGDLARVMQGFSKKANEKLFANMSGRLKNMMVEDIVNLFSVINETYQTDEMAMKKCTEKIAGILDNPSCSDDLLFSDLFALLQ